MVRTPAKKTGSSSPRRRKSATSATSRARKSATAARLEKKVKGHAADAKGLRFEQRVLDYFAKQGWHVRPRQKLAGREFDIVGSVQDGWGNTRYLLVECKDKERVTASDVLAFLAKVQKFHDKLPTDFFGSRAPVKAVVVHTGVLPKDAKDAARAGAVPIQFKKF